MANKELNPMEKAQAHLDKMAKAKSNGGEKPKKKRKK